MRRTDAVDILVLGSIHYVGHQLTDQRVMRALSSQGRRVVYVDPARNILVRARGQTQGSHLRFGLGVAPDGATVFTPAILPRGRLPVLAPLSSLLIAVQMWLALRGRLTDRTVVLAFAAHPTLLLALRRHRRVVVVKDDYVAGSDLVSTGAAQLERRRRVQLNRANSVVTVSGVLRAELLKRGVVATVIAAGVNVPAERGVEPRELAAAQLPRAVFSGMISDRIDLELFDLVLDAGWELVLIGGMQPTFSQVSAFEVLVSRDHVHHLGWRTPDEVDLFLQWCDVGLLPYTLSPFNLASSPLKTLEYLGAGLPVVSTALPAVEALQCPDISLIFSAADLRTQLDRTRTDDATRSRCLDFARRHSWDERAQDYLAVIDGRT